MFDPYTQNITFFTPNSSSPISIPIPLINTWNDETVSIILNYGAQLGASIVMLFVVLFMTPSAKFLRASNLLNLLALVVCIVRTVLLAIYFVTPFSHFYQVWAADYSRIPRWNYNTSVAGTVFALLLVVVTEAALVNQAWTMVSLWAGKVKYTLSFLSAVIALLAVSFRLAYTVIQSESILNLVAPRDYLWLIHATLITNTLSICWFCAIFNSKLVIHLVSNRGLLPSRRAMSPMEVLIMANGMLMVIPVVFAVLEWYHIVNFESGSLTPTSVAIILPLGTIVAQRIAQSSHKPSSNLSSYPSASGGPAMQGRYRTTYGYGSGSGSRTPLKAASLFSTVSNSTTVATRSHAAANNTLASVRDVIDPIDLELQQIDGYLESDEVHITQEASNSQSQK